MSLQGWILAENSWHVVLFGNRALGIAIWIGVAILSIALLILMRTRWGQAQPLSKCVVLSVFAHALLFLYAYGTRLLDAPPYPGGDDAIQVAFVGSDTPPQEGEERTQEQPWEEFATSEPTLANVDEAERESTDGGTVVRGTRGGEWALGEDALPQETLPETQPQRPAVEPRVPIPPRPTESLVKAAAIEEPQPQHGVEARQASLPEPAGPERIETAPAIQRTADRHSEAELPTEVFAVGSRMHQLADVDVGKETADALASRQDQLAHSENRGSSSVDSAGIVQDMTRHAGEGSMVALPAMSDAASAATAPTVARQVVAGAARRIGDGQPLPEPYRLRSLPQRQQYAAALGGSAKAAAAVEAGLAWLAAEQENDGRWDASRWGSGIEHGVAGHDREGAGTDADTGITGLAVLAFLGNGQTHLEGKYRKNVQRGLEFLLRSQAPDGNLAGPARLYAAMYCHGMASLALSEALALTGDARILPYVERAVKYTAGAQHPTSGGWRYQPADQGDMSQFGWQVMALKSASLAGIPIPHATREGMLHFLQRCEQGRHGGLAGYRPGTPATRPMSAESLVCRYFLDLAPSDELVSETSSFLLGELPQTGVPNLYYWYYGTLAMFQAQGEPWTRWNEAMQRQLFRLQRTDGHLAGSWDPDTVWGCYGGRVYSTAMATLCLEVYYRYLPLTALRQAWPGSPEPGLDTAR